MDCLASGEYKATFMFYKLKILN